MGTAQGTKNFTISLDNSVRSSLVEILNDVFPGRDIQLSARADLLSSWTKHKGTGPGRPHAAWDADSNELVTFSYADTNLHPTFGCKVRLESPPTNIDLRIVVKVLKVFDDDCSRCGRIIETQELWRTLKSTQFARAIARFSAFPPISASSWFHTMEDAMKLTYEGSPIGYIVVFFRDAYDGLKRIAKCFTQFRESLSFEQALLREKWIRAVVDGRRVALLAAKRKSGGRITGLISLAALPNAEDRTRFAPHESLRRLQANLFDRDMAIIASPRGSLIVMFGSGAVFQKSQGRWGYLNYPALHSLLRADIPEEVAAAVLRSAIDLAYEGKGAFFCVVDDRKSLRGAVGDTQAFPRANHHLRRSITGLDITDWEDRQVITSASTTDGATFISQTGRLLDIACMVQQAPMSRIANAGFAQRSVFEGARTTAAWNASFFGTVIKVSADGPISVWRQGHELARTV